MIFHAMDGGRARKFLFGALALLITTIFALAAAAGASATTYANFNRVTYAYSTTWSTSQEASTYQMMLMQASDAAMVPQLKAANPNLRIFAYQAIMAAENTTWAYNSCMSGPWVLANHPSWMLKDQYGNPILYQNHYLMDVGNIAYQQACLANAVAMARKDGFDGVYWDMANAKLSWTLPPGATVPEYPTDASWQAAMYSMLSYAGSQLHPNGLMNVANLGGAFLFPGLWAQWNAPLDGAEDEGFTNNKQGTAAALWALPSQLADASWSQANNRFVLLHSWDTTHLGNVFGVASMMLVTGGNSSYSTSNGCYSTCETWYPEYTTAQQLGAPTGAYTTLPNGVFERWFQNGLVLVNPTANTIPSFSLGGGTTFTGSGLTSVSSVSMAPASGLILLADSGIITATAPVNTSAPAIAGSAVVGSKLTANPGSWSGTPTPSSTYQWSRCSSTSSSSCTPISGATAATYTLQSADAGQYIDVTVTATNTAGAASATSGMSAQVQAPTFSLSMSPSSRTIGRGQYTWASAKIAQLNGFKTPVTLSLSGVPAGVTASFNYTTVTTLSNLNVWTTTSAQRGTYTITVTATGGGQTKTATFTLTLT